MEVIIQSLGFKASTDLESYIHEKLQKLEPLSHKIIRADVTLFKGPEGAPESSYCEIRLEAPGNDPFVKKHAATFEQSVSETVDTLHSQLRKNKEKEMDRRHGH